jgi:hypothetical protein
MEVLVSNPDEEEATFKEVQDLFYSIRQERAKDNLDIISDDPLFELMVQVADLANMCEMMFLRLVVLQAEREEVKTEGEEDIQIGLKAFVGSKDAWRKRQ